MWYNIRKQSIYMWLLHEPYDIKMLTYSFSGFLIESELTAYNNYSNYCSLIVIKTLYNKHIMIDILDFYIILSYWGTKACNHYCINDSELYCDFTIEALKTCILCLDIGISSDMVCSNLERVPNWLKCLQKNY